MALSTRDGRLQRTAGADVFGWCCNRSMTWRAQAIARSHRIGQTKEVRVVHLEAVADAEQPAQGAAAPRGQVGAPLARSMHVTAYV